MRSTVYLIYFEWSNTKGNHAGMSYLANRLASDYENVKLIKMISGKSKWKKVLNLLYIWVISMRIKLTSEEGDCVFLMEFLARSCFQDKLATLLHRFGFKGKIIGLVHLAGSHLMEIYKSKELIRLKMELLDKCVVLGSSLASFLKDEVGFRSTIKTFHYVDTDYYKPKVGDRVAGPVRVLCLGNIKRDFNTLRELILSLPTIHFDICQGMLNLQPYFDDCNNVTLHGFVSEDELLCLMQNNDICLSIMIDTVGSNVITTSLATGLILVVSDVGSIRDYCTDECSFLCNDFNDYKQSIQKIAENLSLISQFKIKAIERGKMFSYNNFRNEFEKIIS